MRLSVIKKYEIAITTLLVMVADALGYSGSATNLSTVVKIITLYLHCKAIQ